MEEHSVRGFYRLGAVYGAHTRLGAVAHGCMAPAGSDKPSSSSDPHESPVAVISRRSPIAAHINIVSPLVNQRASITVATSPMRSRDDRTRLTR